MVKAITCPSCGGRVNVKYAERSLCCVCPSCLTVLSNENESVKILVENQKKRATPIITLGERYHFHGHDWEAIGFLLRSDSSETYKWSEYLLFNPYVGYRFLVCMDGHWSYVVKTKSAPVVNESAQTAVYLSKTYKLFHKGKVKTLFAQGEFYWKVKADELVQAVDYICPPEILSLEKDADEEIWSVGEYVRRKDIEKAFKLVGLMPLDVGVAPHEPSGRDDSKVMGAYVGYLVMTLLLIQLGFMVAFKRNSIMQFTSAYTVQGQTVQSPPFILSDKTGYIEARLRAPVSNSWFEYTGEIVNEETGEEYEYDQGVEFYSGYDYDGSWSEGSQSAERWLPSLPPGTYHLNVTPGQGSAQGLTYDIEFSQGNLSWGNFFFTLFLICVYPIYYIMRSSSFEKRRWSQSDYSPYRSANEDD